MVYEFIICFIADIGAGLGTGFVGISATVVTSPMLITFLHIGPYEVVGVALASNMLINVISAYTYDKNENLDIPNGNIMTVAVLCFTLVGSWASSPVPSTTMGNFSAFMALLLGIKFIVKPMMTIKEPMTGVNKGKRITQSVVCSIMVGFICGFVDAGDDTMMLLILTSVLGYELKVTMGTSVFIVTFTVLTGVLSRFAIGGAPDIVILGVYVLPTLLWARIAARFVNRTSPIVLNWAIGVVLAALSVTILTVNYLP